MTHISDYDLSWRDASDILQMRHMLDLYADALAKHGCMEAATETRILAMQARIFESHVEARRKSLYDVWRAVYREADGNGTDVVGAHRRWLESQPFNPEARPASATEGDA